VTYEARPRGRIERKLIAACRRIGYLSAASLCKYPSAGNSFHYAGCLPMVASPGPLQTDAAGRLGGSSRVHVADAACFPTLPSKNLTFTIMANAHRIGAGIARELGA
jgi:choline dehydrogenase-like flavoprotein